MIYRFRKQKELIVSSIFGVLVLWGTFLYIALWGNAPIGGLIAIGLLFSLIIVIGLRTPRYFYIEKDLIIVKLYLGRKVLTDIASVRSISMDELAGSIRLMGNNGLLGYTGWYRKKGLGIYYLMVVNWKELAIVTLVNGKQYVINYPQELLENKQENRNFA